jgi:hypothetical protein
LAAIEWAVDNDRGETIRLAAACLGWTRETAPSFKLTSQFFRAVRDVRLFAAEALLDAGALISLSSQNEKVSREHMMIGCIFVTHDGGWGSLAHLASSRYHMTCWYEKPEKRRKHANEIDFWKQKKRVMEKVLKKIANHEVFRLKDGPHDGQSLCRKELDMAFIHATLADAHSVAVMKFLLGLGANPEAETEGPFKSSALRYALAEEVPALFRAKIDALAAAGVDMGKIPGSDGSLNGELFDVELGEAALWPPNSRENVRYLEWVRRQSGHGHRIQDSDMPIAVGPIQSQKIGMGGFKCGELSLEQCDVTAGGANGWRKTPEGRRAHTCKQLEDLYLQWCIGYQSWKE